MSKLIASRLPLSASALALTLLFSACGESPESLLASGKDYLAKNDGKAAVLQFKNALQQNPKLGEARYLLGSALYSNGDIAGAELEVRKAIELKFSPEKTIPLLSNILLAGGNAKKLLEEFGNVELDSHEAQAALLTNLSVAYAAQGKQAQSMEALRKALSASPDYIPALLTEVRYTAANRDYSSATVKIDNLLQKHPENSDALLLKAGLQGINGDNQAALANYRKALTISPALTMAHAGAISLLLQTEKLDEAEVQLEAMKKVAAKHPSTLYLETLVKYQRKDFKLAREAAQQLLRINPNNPSSLQMAGAVEFQLRSYLQAETYLTKALQAAPNLGIARRLLVATYLQSGQPGKAIEAIQPVMSSIDKDPALLSLAGEAYLQSGDANKASDFLGKASKLDPESATRKTSLAIAHLAKGDSTNALAELHQISESDTGTTADLALIAAYFRSNQIENALKAIDAFQKKQPASPLVHQFRATAMLAKKDIPSARSSLGQALSINPSYFPAAAMLAKLDLVDKKPDDARMRFESVLKSDPKNIQALLALAELKANTGGTVEEVAGLIQKAISAQPNEITPRLSLIQLYLKEKNTKRALTVASDALAAMPDKPEILDAMGRVQKLTGDFNQAITTFGKLATLQPASPVPLLQLADAQFANKNQDEGVKTLTKALEIKPDLVEAQAALAKLAIDGKNSAKALEIAKTIQRQRPKEATGYLLESSIHANSKAWSAAELALRNGLKLNSTPDLAIRLHNILLASGNTAEAEKHATKWLKDYPKDAAFRMHLGDLASARKEYSQSVQHYQSALAIQPNNPLILNNLAWALGKTKSEKALEYALKANQLAPDQPAFMDTYAVLLADKGEHEKAIAMLRKALSISPQAAEIQLNLAKVLIKAGLKNEAKAELDSLSKLGEKFTAQDQVNQLIKSL